MFSIRLFGLAALAATFAVPAAAFAQAPPTVQSAPVQPGARHHGHHHGYRSAVAKLNLSPAQKSQIDQIFAQSRGMNRNADPATRKANMQALHSRIDGVLSPAQRTQLQTTMRQARERRHAHRAAAPGPTPAH